MEFLADAPKALFWVAIVVAIIFIVYHTLNND